MLCEYSKTRTNFVFFLKNTRKYLVISDKPRIFAPRNKRNRNRDRLFSINPIIGSVMKKAFIFAALVAVSLPAALRAEEPEPAVTFSVGADVVSSYIWRGQNLGGLSVQPSATVTFNKPGISLGAWASAELFSSGQSVNMREFDLVATWSPIDALSISVTDYYFCSANYLSAWTFGYDSSHTIEGGLSYDFGPLALAWNTVFAGVDHNEENGERSYSTYVELSAPYKLCGVEGKAAIGASLWEDSYTQAGTDGFKVCNISLSANKELFNVPFMGQIVFNPYADKVFFVVGLSF